MARSRNATTTQRLKRRSSPTDTAVFSVNEASQNGPLAHVEQEGDALDNNDDELTPDEKAERKAEKLAQQMVQMADRALNRWSEAQPVEVQQAVVDAFVETGILDHEAAGMEETRSPGDRGRRSLNALSVTS